jgi:hypothetical protein
MCQQGEVESGGARGRGDRVFDAEQAGELSLKSGDLRALGQHARVQYTKYRRLLLEAHERSREGNAMGGVTLTDHTVFQEGSADPTVHDLPKASTFLW